MLAFTLGQRHVPAVYVKRTVSGKGTRLWAEYVSHEQISCGGIPPHQVSVFD